MIIVKNKPYYTEREKISIKFSNTNFTSVYYIPYSKDDPDFADSTFVDENIIAEYDDYDNEHRAGFYGIIGVDKCWYIIQVDMKWSLPHGVNGKSEEIVSELKRILSLDREGIASEIGKETYTNTDYCNYITKQLNKVIESDFPEAIFTNIKKIYIDYPAYAWKPRSTAIFGEDSFPYTNSLDGINRGIVRYVNGESYSSDTSDRVIPDTPIKYVLNGSGLCKESTYHNCQVYPDPTYIYIKDNNIIPWLDWLTRNAETIASTYAGDSPGRQEAFSTVLKGMILAAKSLSNLVDYKFGILRIWAGNRSAMYMDREPHLVLYSGSYIKESKYIVMDSLTDFWKDLTYTPNESLITSDHVSKAVLTIGYEDVLDETMFLENRPVISIFPFIRNDPSEKPRASTCPGDLSLFGLEKLSTSNVYDVYSSLIVPYDSVYFSSNDTHLYNKYSFGKNFKYKKAFIPSPVFNFPLFYGYFSHAIRYGEGIIQGMEPINH